MLHLDGANSAELDPTQNIQLSILCVIKLTLKIWVVLFVSVFTMWLKPGSKVAAAYGNQEVVQRRHRHRYEFNTKFREQFEAEGFVFSGVSPDNRLMEVVELPDKKFFVAAQHPEYHSRPNHAEELYTAFVTAALKMLNNKLGQRGQPTLFFIGSFYAKIKGIIRKERGKQMAKFGFLSVLEEELDKHLDYDFAMDWDKKNHAVEVTFILEAQNSSNVETIDDKGEVSDEDVIFEDYVLFYNPAKSRFDEEDYLVTIPYEPQERSIS